MLFGVFLRSELTDSAVPKLPSVDDGDDLQSRGPFLAGSPMNTAGYPVFLVRLGLIRREKKRAKRLAASRSINIEMPMFDDTIHHRTARAHVSIQTSSI